MSPFVILFLLQFVLTAIQSTVVPIESYDEAVRLIREHKSVLSVFRNVLYSKAPYSPETKSLMNALLDFNDGSLDERGGGGGLKYMRLVEDALVNGRRDVVVHLIENEHVYEMDSMRYIFGASVYHSDEEMMAYMKRFGKFHQHECLMLFFGSAFSLE